MKKLNVKDVTSYVEKNISKFHDKRIDSLDSLKLTSVLRRKNPYLFRAKYVLTASEIVNKIVEAHISSHEETIFGDWLEELAIFINKKVYGGWKSGIPGVDLEFDDNGKRYIVAIKSGPNWGNSSQIQKMKSDFTSAKKTLRTSNSDIQVIAVNGCCYGRQPNSDRGEYFKYCGQEFWKFISGDESLYLELIEPLGRKAKERNDSFQRSYARMLNKFVREFTVKFCNESGEIDWDKLVKFNSGTNVHL